MKVVNLDHLSANPLLPPVQDAMIEAVKKNYGNPSSQHRLGDKAAEVLESARESAASLIGCRTPKEVVFTSGGTESVNHAIKGAALALREKGRHIVSSNIEHNAVLRALRRLKLMDYKVTSLPVDPDGRVDPQDVAKAIRGDTILVTIMHSNNEIGTLEPIREIAQITRERKVLFHTDAVDSVGVLPVNVQELGVDLLSFASNTFYGPAGVGGLYVRSGTKLWPLLDGGVQENNKRAGAENLIGIVGMGVAADLAREEMPHRMAHVRSLREKLLRELPRFVDEYHINGHPEHCLPHLVSISIKYVEGESIVLLLDEEGFAVSTRSACAAGALQASHVLLSIGRDFADAQGTLVISLGMENTAADIDRFLPALRSAVATLRKISPLYN